MEKLTRKSVTFILEDKPIFSELNQAIVRSAYTNLGRVLCRDNQGKIIHVHEVALTYLMHDKPSVFAVATYSIEANNEYPEAWGTFGNDNVLKEAYELLINIAKKHTNNEIHD